MTDNFRNIRRTYLLNWSLHNFNRKYKTKITEGCLKLLYTTFILSREGVPVNSNSIFIFLKKSYKSVQHKLLKNRLQYLTENGLILKEKRNGFFYYSISTSGIITLHNIENFCRKARPPR